MDRRDFLITGIAAVAGWRLAKNTEHALVPPPLDKPWPLDLRPGFVNGDGYNVEVWLNNEKLGGVVAVDPTTGYYIQVRHTEVKVAVLRNGEDIYPDPETEQRLLKLLSETKQDPATWQVAPYEVKMVSCWATPLPQPCACPPGLHGFREGDAYCVPYELKQGPIQIKRITV